MSDPSRPADAAQLTHPGGERIVVLDVLRGLAIVGTLGTNIWAFASLEGATGLLFTPREWWASVDDALLTGTLYLTNGRFLGLLAILFGVGLEIQRRAAARRGGPWLGRYSWRNALLFAIGAAHFVFVFEHDILMGYAVAAVIVAWLANGPSRRLIAGMAVAAALHLALYGSLATLLQPEGGFVLPAGGSSSVVEQIDTEATQVALEGSYLDGVDHRLNYLAGYRFEVVTLLPLNVLLFGLGVGLFRWGVFDATSRARRRAWRLALFGLGLGGLVNLVAFAPDARLLWLGRYVFAPLLSVGYLGVMVLVARSLPRALDLGLTAVGRTALTCYVLQNLLAIAVFHGWGLGWKGQLGAAGTLLVGAAISSGLAIAAHLWLKRFARGPIEGPWRWLAARPRRDLRGSPRAPRPNAHSMRDPTEGHGTTDLQRKLDEPVPAPWPARRRALASIAVLAAVGLALTSAHSGLTGPRLGHDHWGGSVDATDPDLLIAERIVALRNDGWIPVTIEAFEPPDLEYLNWRGVEGLPTTLEPGSTSEIVVRLEMAGCNVHMRGYNVYPFRARSGLAPSRVVEVEAPHSIDPTARATHRTDDGDMVLPVWPDQPPSWILDAIAPPCQTPPETDK